jgi:hypothetical protein
MATESPTEKPLRALAWAFAIGVTIVALSSCAPAATVAPATEPPGSTQAPAATSAPANTSVPVMPEFPWPPPEPSAIAYPTLGAVGNRAGTGATLGDVDSRIAEALAAGGYDEKAYYGVRGGFAVVTSLEQIDLDGFPEYSDRWATELAPLSFEAFSLDRYLQALFSVPKGHYRIFVFIVTRDLVIQSGTPVSQGVAQTWVLEGANKLPGYMTTIRYTKEYSCTVYVYEFVQSGVGEEANQNIPSRISGKEHLEHAGLWETLER